MTTLYLLCTLTSICKKLKYKLGLLLHSPLRTEQKMPVGTHMAVWRELTERGETPHARDTTDLQAKQQAHLGLDPPGLKWYKIKPAFTAHKYLSPVAIMTVNFQ